VSLTPIDRNRIEKSARAAGLADAQIVKLLEAINERLGNFTFWRAQPRQGSNDLRRDLKSVQGAADKLRKLLFRQLAVLEGQPLTTVVREVYAPLRAAGLLDHVYVLAVLQGISIAAQQAKAARGKSKSGAKGTPLDSAVSSVMWLAWTFSAADFKKDKAGDLFCLLVEILNEGTPVDADRIQRRIRALLRCLPRYMQDSNRA
jgi:hypothetical protein